MRLPSLVKIALSLAVVALVLPLAGCGEADPFTGSWKATGKKSDGRDLVIAKTDGAYQVAFVGVSDCLTAKQEGDTLRLDWLSTSPPHTTGWMTLTHDSGRLLVREKGLSATEFIKVSDGTTAPSPAD